MTGYIVVYGSDSKTRGIVANALQDRYCSQGLDAMIYTPFGAQYTKAAVHHDISVYSEFDILIYNVYTYSMIPKTSQQLFKVRVDNG